MRPLAPLAVTLLCLLLARLAPADPTWEHLSSKAGQLPVPSNSTQQTGAVVGDFDGDKRDDFVLAFRQTGPALVLFRHHAGAWERLVIEPETLHLEAGGAVLDIDGDGDLDVVFGNDFHGADLWWWENPSPNLVPKTPWKRHVIKTGGAKQLHDQVFGDFLGTGKAQLAFWNQKAMKLFMAEIPPDVRNAAAWPLTEVFTIPPVPKGAKASTPYAEGVWAADVDADGKVDLLAGNYWFKHTGGKAFKPCRIADYGGRIAAAHLVRGTKYPQVVIASGDGVGPLAWYDCPDAADPRQAESWTPRELLPKMVHGHSLQVADVDRDGHLDVLAAEMAKWKEKTREPDHPTARAWIFYGDGKGNFRQTVLAEGMGFHEAKLGDFNGDGKLDILQKPYCWETPRVDLWMQK